MVQYSIITIMKKRIYLDDVRTPVDQDWIVVRTHDELVSKVVELGLENIQMISLDHDLDDSAMHEYFTNVSPHYKLDYANITESTGMDSARWLVRQFYTTNPEWPGKSRPEKKESIVRFPIVVTHSANPIGSANIMGYINNFLMNEAQPQTCIRVNIEHTVKK